MTDNARPLRTLTLEEAAAFLQVHKSTVRELAKAGVIPGAKVGRAWRFLESDLIAFVRGEHAQGGAACLFINSPAAKSGGLRSHTPVKSGYVSRLENMIAKQRNASTMNVKLHSGNRPQP